MVMSALREKIKIVILVTLIAFVGLIFFDWGMQKGSNRQAEGGVIGEVNGEAIPYDQYRRTRQSILAGFEQRTGRSAEFGDMDAIEDETWLTLVQERLVRQEIEDHEITVTDAEILDLLRTTPPDIVRAQPDFLDESGQFDPVRYQAALSNPAFEPLWVQVESYIRAVYPNDKIQNYVGLGAHVTAAEVREAFVAQNEKAKARYVQSPPSRVELPEDAFGESELTGYYESHREDFRKSREAVLDMVTFSKAPTAQDSAAARADLEDIRQAILEGSDFAEEAATWSEDPSAERGGDLGFIGRGDLPHQVEDVAFSLDPGEISEVFASPFGYHILKVEEKKTEDGQERVNARHILLRVETSNQTLRDAGNQADDFVAAYEESGDFAEAAAEAGLEVVTTEPFERGAVIPGLGLMRGAQRFAFGSTIGAVTTEPVEDDRGLYVFRLAELLEPRIAPFEEVRDRVEVLVREEKRRELAREKLASALQSAGGQDLEAVAQAMGAVIDTTIEFSRESFVPGVGRRNSFVAAAFTNEPGSMSDLIESDRGFYVVEVLERIPADEATFAEQQETIRQQLFLRKRQTLIAAWLDQLLAEAEIIDYRSGEGVEWEPDPSLLVYDTSS